MNKIGLIVENSKELYDYIIVLNELSKEIDLEVKIVLLADIYFDNKQKEFIKKINFKYKLYELNNPFQKPFKEYSFFEKIKLVKDFSKILSDFTNDINLLLSGVQTVFERVLYSYIKKNNLPIKTIVYHRHLLFDDRVNTSSNRLMHNKLVYLLLNLFGLEGLLIEKKAIGFSNKYMVLGEINKNYLLNSKIDEKDIYTVGSIEYDDIEIYYTEQKNDKISHICYITSACEWIGDVEGEEYQKEKIQNIIKFSQDNNLNLTIRIHPRENYKKYELLQKKYPFIKLQYPSNIKLLKDLQNFDLIVGGFSTVLFEAMLINKKVLFYSLKEEEYRYKELLNNFTFPYITNTKDFFEQIKYNENIPKDKFIKYDNNEKALERILKAIMTEICGLKK